MLGSDLSGSFTKPMILFGGGVTYPLWHQLIATVQAQGIEPIVEPTVQRWFPEPFRTANPAACLLYTSPSPRD